MLLEQGRLLRNDVHSARGRGREGGGGKVRTKTGQWLGISVVDDQKETGRSEDMEIEETAKCEEYMVGRIHGSLRWRNTW